MSRKNKNKDTKDNSISDGNVETKKCSCCRRVLPVSSFNYWNKKLGSRMGICKDCEKERNRRKHEHKKEILQELKSVGCCVCGEKELCCLDFHHIDQEHKEFNMGSALNKTDGKIVAEATKCVVVCSNCHRKIHGGVLNIYDYINESQYKYMRKLFDLIGEDKK